MLGRPARGWTVDAGVYAVGADIPPEVETAYRLPSANGELAALELSYLEDEDVWRAGGICV